MAALKLYFDFMSQPSRSVYMFLKASKIPFTPKPIALRKGEHFTEEFKKINPLSRVPVIDNNQFVLTESVAILKYLCVKYNVADHWYPRDLQAQVRVDEYMSWHHLGLRIAAASLFREKLIIPMAKGKPINQEKVQRWKKLVNEALDGLETAFLKTPFVSGNEISVGDVLGVCELTQLYAVKEEALFTQRPLVNAWVERVTQRLQPHFDAAHQMIYRVRDRYDDMKMAKL
ncbi:glutathione S-transferase theta-1-like [Liolophura sinensis]|uniref:glutathione S-transferase theta-1-like n=1 Tax=Liolophura sinensis TaxID=3198878 RepID=UPI003158F47B